MSGSSRIRRRLLLPWHVAALAVLVPLLGGSLAGSTAPTERRRGPRDWSHAHLVAAGWGAGDSVVQRDWRTLRRHLALDDDRARRQAWAGWMAWFRQGGLLSNEPSSGPAVTLNWTLNTGGTGPVGSYPTRFTVDPSGSNCGDVIYFTVDHRGGPRTPNLIGLTNLYAGCPDNPLGTWPTVKFAIALPWGTATSPALSLDGRILYVVESRPAASGGAVLHAILVDNIAHQPGRYSFREGTWLSVHTLAPPDGTAGSEQLFEITFAGVEIDRASPYVDYANDRIYIADGAGRVHRIRNAADARASQEDGWPMSCGRSPHQAVVAWDNQAISASADGRLYRIDTAAAAPRCLASAPLGGGEAEGPAGGLAAPILDVANGRIIAVTGDAAAGEMKAIALYQLRFQAGEAPLAVAPLGDADGISPQYPALDHAFWSTNDGNVYAVGASADAGTLLLRLPYNGLTLLPASGAAALHRVGPPRSVPTTPVAEVVTPARGDHPDVLFVGGLDTRYRFLNRIPSAFGGSLNAPVAMEGIFGAGSGISSAVSADTQAVVWDRRTHAVNMYFGTAGGAVQSTIVHLTQVF